MHHHAQLIFCTFSRDGFHDVDQAGLELLTSGDLPVSASQNPGITGVSHCIWPIYLFIYLLEGGLCYIAQPGLELLGSNNDPTLAFISKVEL